MKQNEATYTADDIKHLKGLEGVRKRPAMYVGAAPSSEALLQMLVEVLDNAVDEAAEGHANQIEVVLHADGSYSVTDNGRGIPCSPLKGDEQQRSALEVVFSELHSGGKFEEKAYSTAGGLHGVGVAVVNALSHRMEVEVKRDQRKYRLHFCDQQAGYFSTGDKFKPLPKTRRLRSTSSASPKTGTKIRFWADPDLFPDDASITYDQILNRLEGLAWLLPKTKFKLLDEASGQSDVVISKAGLLDGVEKLAAPFELITKSLGVVDEAPLREGSDTTCRVRAAFSWTTSEQPIIRSYVNTIPTSGGGSHLEGFEKALLNPLRAAVRKSSSQSLKSVGDKTLRTDEAFAGLVAVIQVQLHAPHFRGQTKETLSEPLVADVVAEVVGDYFTNWLAKSSGTNQKALLRSRQDLIIERHEIQQAVADTKAAKKVSKSRVRIEKLRDARQHPNSELLIVEGDSAAGTAKRARNADWQALLSLRGKIINAAKSSLGEVLKNAEIQSIIAAVGAGVGKDFDLEAARYRDLILLMDADSDGAHIRALLLTFLWHHMRPLLTEGRVFVAEPPSHALVLQSDGSKTFYYSEQDTMTAATELKEQGRKVIITRFKGLGEMEDSELAETCLNPDTRTLRQIIVPPDADGIAASEEMVDLWLGKNADARRTEILKALG